jgi:hypothetical protein
LFVFAILANIFLVPLFFFALHSLVFIGKNRGGRDRGGHCAAAPPPPLQHVKSLGKWGSLVGVFLKGSRRLFEGEGGGKQRKKNLLLPLLRASRGRRRPTVPFKTAPFRASLFFFTVNETTLFWAKRTVSFK